MLQLGHAQRRRAAFNVAASRAFAFGSKSHVLHARGNAAEETLERCFEIIDGRPVQVKSRDPRLRAQRQGVRFVD